MPKRDGTGPMGAGSMTGGGLGLCTDKNAVRHSAGLKMRSCLGLSCRHGFGGGFRRGFAINQNSAERHKDLLQEQKELLQNRLKAIDKQLEDI